MELSNPYITDVVLAAHQFENGTVDSIKWYQFKVPISEYDAKIELSATSVPFVSCVCI